MENNFSDEMDQFGVPVTERPRIEVSFRHNDRDAIAVFTFGEDECSLESMHFVDDQSPIYPKEVLDLDEIENEAIDKYLDQCQGE